MKGVKNQTFTFATLINIKTWFENAQINVVFF